MKTLQTYVRWILLVGVTVGTIIFAICAYGILIYLINKTFGMISFTSCVLSMMCVSFMIIGVGLGVESLRFSIALIQLERTIRRSRGAVRS